MDSDIFNNPYVIISILFIGAQYVIRPFIELITQRDKKDAVVEQRLIALTKPPDKPIDLSGQQPSVKPPETLPPHVIPAPASL